ncbi:hypothetical protein FWC63_00295 [Candidatus Saccharibacteria bacterium]|nr:hypothetical protein [Candidatus Saccharibacteria bacterium]
MGKEIIHIEVDEDIAGIIGRVMAAKEKVVAVVAPKNLGALRSAMNLKLLKKAAKNSGKVTVVISDNPAMKNLAGVAGVALAPNLETKPTIPEVSVAEGQIVVEELRSGEPLTIAGDLDGDGQDDILPKSPAKEIDMESGEEITSKDKDTDGIASEADQANKKRKFNALTSKVDKVWQKALIIGAFGVGAMAIGVAVMVIAVRPQAVVNITTQMDNIDVRRDVRFQLNNNDVPGGLFALQERNLEAEQVEEFEATGEREEGTRASGQITIRHCGPASQLTTDNFFEANGRRYRLGAAVTLPGAPCGNENNWGTTTVVVTAAEIGDEFNLASGQSMILSTDRESYQTRVTSNGISGGTRQIIRIVSEEDVRNALAQMDGTSVEEGRSRLIASLEDDRYAFSLTFRHESGAVEVTPRVGEPVGNGGRATVRRTQTFRIMTTSRTDMERFAMQLAEQTAGEQTVYDIGSFTDGRLFLERIEITQQTGGTTCEPDAEDCVPTPGQVREMTASMKTIARVGDEIPEDEVRAAIVQMAVGDAQREVSGFPGVQRVSINLTPFWVRRLPRDQSRIEINIRADD